MVRLPSSRRRYFKGMFHWKHPRFESQRKSNVVKKINKMNAFLVMPGCLSFQWVRFEAWSWNSSPHSEHNFNDIGTIFFRPRPEHFFGFSSESASASSPSPSNNDPKLSELFLRGRPRFRFWGTSGILKPSRPLSRFSFSVSRLSEVIVGRLLRLHGGQFCA